MKVIALTGGIGSGKSIVSRTLLTMGYPVYDCDSHAKRVMDDSAEIKARLVDEFGSGAVSPTGIIDRKHIGDMVFGDAGALKRLNAIVHPAVRQDLVQWLDSHQACSCTFVETAILHESNLGDMIDCEWNVYAPIEVRIERVMKRNGLSRDAVVARINSQGTEVCFRAAEMIVNDGKTAVLPQVERLLSVMGVSR